MQINEVPFEDATPIDGYGAGFFRVGGTVYEGGVAILPSGLAPWQGYGDRDRLLAHADAVDVVIVGTGAEMTYLPRGFREALEGAGIGVEAMASGQACRTYNVLLGEGRRVGAALLPL